MKRVHGVGTFYFKNNIEDIQEYVEGHISFMTAERMAKHFNCSLSTMRRWLRQLGYYGGMRKHTEKLTSKQIGEMIGIPVSNFITAWKRNGFSPKKYAGYGYTSFEELEEFMKTHPHLWQAELCDPTIFEGLDWFDEIKNNGNNKAIKKKWTSREESLLCVLWENGKSIEEIAYRTGRSEEAVRKRVAKFFGGISNESRTSRKS